MRSSFLGNLEVIELNPRKVNNINPHVMIQTYSGTKSLVAIVIRDSRLWINGKYHAMHQSMKYDPKRLFSVHCSRLGNWAYDDKTSNTCIYVFHTTSSTKHRVGLNLAN